MPVLRVDPNTGESLDLSKTAEEAKAEEIQRTKDLAELKERIRLKKPRKKKEVVEEPKSAGPVLVKDVPVKVNPFTSPNGEINAEELVEPLNAILKDVEHSLQLITKGYKLVSSEPYTSKINLPEKLQYKSGVTRINDGSEAFNLNKPGIINLDYKDLHKDLYIDRVALKPLDVRELLKYPDKTRELLKDLVIDNMWKNLWEVKQLDPKKKYFGIAIGTLKRPGLKDSYCSVVSGDIDFIEIRLYSDATPLPEGT